MFKLEEEWRRKKWGNGGETKGRSRTGMEEN